MFLPSDVARREAINRGIPWGRAEDRCCGLRAIGEFDGVSALGHVSVPVLSIGSAVQVNAMIEQFMAINHL